MCIYAVYQYRHCKKTHTLGDGPRGGRAFRTRPCKLNTMANEELKDSNKSRFGICDHALPCEGQEGRIYYVDQICHVCNPRGALTAGYPLNKNYWLTAASILEWDIPYNQIKFDDFREISYINPKKDSDEEQPLSPKGLFREIPYSSYKVYPDTDSPISPKSGPSISPEESYNLGDSSMQGSCTNTDANQRILPSASDNSNLSQSELRPQRLQVRLAQWTHARIASPSSHTENTVRLAAPVLFESHPGNTFFESC